MENPLRFTSRVMEGVDANMNVNVYSPDHIAVTIHANDVDSFFTLARRIGFTATDVHRDRDSGGAFVWCRQTGNASNGYRYGDVSLHAPDGARYDDVRAALPGALTPA